MAHGSATRRGFLKGSAALISFLAYAGASPAAMAQGAGRNAEPQRWFYLTAAEAAFLRAAVDRIIPRDEFPSASEAGVVDYIDLQLATSWGQGAGLYLKGPFADGTDSQGYQLPYAPAEMYRRAIAAVPDALGGRFEDMDDIGRDNFLTRLSNSEIDLGDIPGGIFFTHLRANTLEGYFADPVYNGNRNHAGWQMVGFPGAHAYYLTEVDRYNMRYFRPPSGIAYRPGRGAPQPFTAQRVNRREAAHGR